MSYAQQTSGLARTLAHLLADGPQDLDDVALAQALLARSATLILANTVHAHVTGRATPWVASRVAALATDPVGVLGRLLTDHPRIPGTMAPTDALDASSSSPAGVHWRRAARQALLAQDEWDRRTGFPAAVRHQAWALLADVAALTEAVACLERDLARAAATPGHGTLADALHDATGRGLRLAAATVRALASDGPLQDPDITSRRTPPARVVQVRTPRDLPRAELQLCHLLHRAEPVRAEHAAQIAIGQARLAAAASRVLRRAAVGPGDDRPEVADLADAVERVATCLAHAASRPGCTASLDRGDERPVQQAGEIARLVLGWGSTTPGPTDVDSATEVALDVARAIPATVRALGAVTRQETAAGRWLVRTHDLSTSWARYTGGLHLPAVLVAVDRAVPALDDLRRALGSVDGSRPAPAPLASGPSARAALADALAQVPRHRPVSPAYRPPPRAHRARPHAR